MDGKNAKRRETPNIYWMAALLLDLIPGSGKEYGLQDLADGARSLTAVAEPRFGLSAEERIVRVIMSLFGDMPEETAEALGFRPDQVASLAGSAARKLASGAERRALILEDAWLAQRELEFSCQRAGVEVVLSTAHPALVMPAYRAFRPGVALLDLELGDNPFAGEIVAMDLRQADPNIRLLLTTGYQKADMIAALLPNCKALIKPIRAAVLDRHLEPG